MDLQELTNNITKLLQNGQSKEAITTQLLSQGLQLSQIESAFQTISLNNSQTSSQQDVKILQHTNINDIRKKEGRGILLIILITITVLYNLISLPSSYSFFSEFLNSKYFIPTNFLSILSAFWILLSTILEILVIIAIW